MPPEVLITNMYQNKIKTKQQKKAEKQDGVGFVTHIQFSTLYL